ncbi:hypothetical protein AYK26_02885 [Euryarchaeota archaeon SM23-78]|nr:MAG: hypothetical protein AYK26_02885 [Euryarchaeota archaeon SM23-78]MBW3001360.1 hypothetical protein [Candidatus Woesearchaeota archaeon]
MIINSTSFKSITVDGKEYPYDIWIFADGTVKERNRNHEFTLEEFETITKGGPEVLIIGTGQYGVVKISEEVFKAAKEKAIEIIYDKTPEAIKRFNEVQGKKMAAAIHTTC